MNFQNTNGILTPIGLIQGSSLVAADSTVALSLVLPSAQTTVLYNLAFKYATLKSLAIYCAVACTIRTNSSSEPDNTFAIPAGWGLMWDVNCLFDNPITADVTALYLSNVLAGQFSFCAGIDPTP